MGDALWLSCDTGQTEYERPEGWMLYTRVQVLGSQATENCGNDPLSDSDGASGGNSERRWPTFDLRMSNNGDAGV